MNELFYLEFALLAIKDYSVLCEKVLDPGAFLLCYLAKVVANSGKEARCNNRIQFQIKGAGPAKFSFVQIVANLVKNKIPYS